MSLFGGNRTGQSRNAEGIPKTYRRRIKHIEGGAAGGGGIRLESGQAGSAHKTTSKHGLLLPNYGRSFKSEQLSLTPHRSDRAHSVAPRGYAARGRSGLT